MKINELFDLTGKVALVTGGGRGLGKFMATGLAEAGADVVITSRKMKNLEATAAEIGKECGVKVLPFPCDISKEEDIDNLLKAAKEQFPRIDILLNNAGATWGAPTLEFPLERWDQVFNVNVRGVWMLTQKVARIMKEQGGGNIINLSSIMGYRGVEEELFPAIAYNSTKAAIRILTMNLAVKLASYNIRVNGIAPGFYRTDMSLFFEKPEFKDSYDKLMDKIPMRRMGDIDDIKGVAVFLASDASAYMNGHVLVTDGGYPAK